MVNSKLIILVAGFGKKRKYLTVGSSPGNNFDCAKHPAFIPTIRISIDKILFKEVKLINFIQNITIKN